VRRVPHLVVTLDVWAAIADPDVPHDVTQRLLADQADSANGLVVGPLPDADMAHLSRHLRHQCAAHDELVYRDTTGEWAHMSDHRVCMPRPDIDITEEKTA
jgi:hypothetical protein